VCKGLNGHNEEAARTLEALLILGDQLLTNAAFTQRLHVRATDRRDRDGWVAAELEVTDGVKLAKVAEDLALFELPYSAHVLAARTCAADPGGWAGAAAAAHLPRYPGGGSTPPAAAAPAAVAPAAAAPERAPEKAPTPPRDVPRIVSFDPVNHLDVPDAALDILDSTPAARVPHAMARIVACDPEDLSGTTTGVLIASLCHTLVSVGESVVQWAHEPTNGVRPEHAERLLRLVSRRNLLEVFVRKTGVAHNGAERRYQHRQDRGGGHVGAPPAQRHRGPSGGYRDSAPGGY